MKNKILIVTILFFLAVNTSYLWLPMMGSAGFFVVLPLMAFYAFLFFVFLVYAHKTLFVERFKDKTRLLITAILGIVLLCTFLRPTGLIDFDQLSGKNFLVAKRTSTVSCTTIFRLKPDKFVEETNCFGAERISGNYKLIKDTIFFKDIEGGRDSPDYYSYAVIHYTEKGSLLVRYKDDNDTLGSELYITENALQ